MRSLRSLSLLLAVTCLACAQTTPQEQGQQQQQQATIVLLHRRGSRCNEDAANETISPAALQREQAAQWATEIINNQTRMLSIGIEVADTCGTAASTEFRARQIVNQTQLTPIIGVIALEEPQVLNDAAVVLRRHRIPLVVATPKASEVLFYSNQSGSESLGPSNVFSAVPNSASIARATMAVARGIHSPSIRILSTCSRTLEAARKAARQLRIRVISSEHWSSEHSSTISFIDGLNYGANMAVPPVVALLMEPAEMQKFMNEALTQRAARHVTWLLGSLETIGPQVAAQWTMMLSNSAFLIEPHDTELAGLAQFLESKGVYSQPIENEVPHIVQAISSLGAAFHLQELDNCFPSADGNITCKPLRLTDPSSLPADMLNALRKVSLPKTEDNSGMPTDEVARELEGTSSHFTSSGRLVANRYLIQKLVAGTGESSPVAWYSDDEGLVLAIQSNDRFYFFSSPGPPLAPVQPFLHFPEQDETIEQVVQSEVNPTVDHSVLPTDSAVLDNHLDTPEDSLDDISSLLVTSTPHHSRSLFFQGRTWAAAIVALAATEFLAAIYILGLMLLRLYQGTLQNQGFDLLLLVSLIGQLITVVLFVLPMSLTMHQLKLFLPPVLLVFSYTIMLIKLMQSAGPSPQCHLYLILMLAVAVQTAVSCHFYSQQPQQELYTVPECNLTQFLLLYLFLVVLVAMTTGHAIYLRQQSRSVLITSSLSTASVAIWLLCCTWLQSEFRDAATAVLVVVLSAVLLGANFIPKVAQMNQIQRQVQGKTQQPWQPPLSFNDKFAASQLSGSALMRHPAYIGRHGI